MKCYVDASGSGDDRVFVMAGYVATDDAWPHFCIDWQELLDESPALKAFKMNKLRRRPTRCERFYRVIEKHVALAVSCYIPVDELAAAVDETPWPHYISGTAALKDPYYFAFKAIIDLLAQHQSRLRIDESVDFVFDTETQGDRCLSQWNRMLISSDPSIRVRIGGVPEYQDDKSCLPLQAADMYAYWVRKWWLDGQADGIENLTFPWQADLSLPRMSFEFCKADFLQEFQRFSDPAVLARARLNDDEVDTRL